MVPFLGGCDALKGSVSRRKYETEKLDFSDICDGLKGIRHLSFHQESVHRCSLGCSRYPSLDF